MITTVYVSSILVSGGVFITLAVYSWKRRSMQGVRAFIFQNIIGAIGALADAASVISGSPEGARFFFNLRFVTLAFLPVAWFIFSYQYSGGKKLNARRIALILVIPAVTQVMVWTNDWHGLWLVHDVDFVARGSFLIADTSRRVPAVWFIVHSVYGYLALTAGMVIIFRSSLRLIRFFRMQGLLAFSGMIILMMGALVPTLNLFPKLPFNPITQSLALCAVLFFIAIFRYRLLNIAPVARDVVIDGMEDGMMVINNEDRIIDMNRAMKGLLDAASLSRGQVLPEKMIGMSVNRALRSFADVVGPYSTVSEGIAEISVDIGGAQRFFDLRISPLRDRAGDIMARVAVTREITDRKRKEEEMRKSRDAAEAASRAKSDFLSTMSHELRTPVGPIIGLTHLLDQTALTDIQRGYVDSIRESSVLLLGTINNILEITKIEAGRVEIKTADFILDEELRYLSAAFARAAHVKGLELVIDPDPAVPAVLRGDARRLRQVLASLIENAIKFSEKGTIVLSISLTRRDGERGERLLFSCRDEGIGLSEDQVRSIFLPFSQGDASITRRYGGTGLGLAISGRLVDLMGGVLGVNSDQGRGSEFYFSLPLKAPESASAGIGPAAAGEAKRVLVVDDNPVSREVIAKQCRSLGFRTVTAGDGAGALRIIEENPGDPFHFALVDMIMPGPGGVETARLIGRTGDGPGPAVFLMVPAGMTGSVPVPEGEYVRGVAEKPLLPSALFQLMGSVPDENYAEADGGNKMKEGPVSTGSAEDQILKSRAGKRILVAEDNFINQRVMIEILETAGFTVDAAENGKEALNLLAVNDYDLVLMDIQMPEMDGLEAARRIRADGRNPGIPIIAMTAYDAPEDRSRCLEAGMNDHAAKPVDPEELFRVIGRCIGTTAGRSAPSPVLTNRSADRLPDDIPGIDIAGALKRLAGDRGLLRKVIIEFRDECRNSADDTDRFLEKNDLAAAAMRVHAVRGAAGNIGAAALFDAASDLERALRENDPGRAPLAARFRKELDTVLRGAAVLGNAVREGAADTASILSRLDTLRVLLEENNFRAVEAFGEIRGHGGGIFNAEIERIGESIGAFDYEKAKSLLDDFSRKLREGLSV